MSKFTDEEDALNAKRCPRCKGNGYIEPYNGQCPSCVDGDGIKIDPFDKWWKNANSRVYDLPKGLAENIFNAGRESK